MLRKVVCFSACSMLLKNVACVPARMCTVDQECASQTGYYRGFRHLRTVCWSRCALLMREC